MGGGDVSPIRQSAENTTLKQRKENMKQHITEEQLDEFKKMPNYYPSLDKLNSWIHDHDYKDEGWAEFLTIGRMIEFLDEVNFNWCWTAFEDVGYHDDPHFVRDGSTELCDALWAAVKEILEGNKI